MAFYPVAISEFRRNMFEMFSRVSEGDEVEITYNGHVFRLIAKDDEVPDKLKQVKPIKNLYRGDVDQIDNDLAEIWRELSDV
jgi:prevent-host-death family protein